MLTHYKLPIDTEVDKDILDWINSFHRTKKGEMVRHAIRYYMSVLEEGETIKFPSVSHQHKPVEKPKVVTRERVRPKLNGDALK